MDYHGRKPLLCYKIRKTNSNNATGDSFALTVPREIAEKFIGINFILSFTGSVLIYQSGTQPSLRNKTEEVEQIVR